MCQAVGDEGQGPGEANHHASSVKAAQCYVYFAQGRESAEIQPGSRKAGMEMEVGWR